MPLHVEILYNEYQFAAAFAVASLLAMLALVTLIVKTYVEWRSAEALGAEVPAGGGPRDGASGAEPSGQGATP
jgi:sulfate transport system permease protein